MRPEDVREFLKRQPFQPFRLTLTDGRSYDILHPELALVGRSWVGVGLARPGDPEGVADRLVTVSLLHIMQIEPLESVVPPPGH
ncbi:MAG: hypothetical protein ABSH35_14235 [Isosphaeraceae bacterium]